MRLSAQDSINKQKVNKYNFPEFFHEAGSYLKQPTKWKGGDLLKMSAIGVVTFSLMQVDEKIRRTALNNPKYAKSLPMEIGKQWGGFFFIPITAVTLLTHGAISHNQTTKKLGFEIAEAVIFSETTTFISKGFIGRSRPFTNHGAFDYHPFTFFNSPHNSFPAGHVGAAFALSSVLSKNVDSGFLKVIAYIPAFLTAASRVYQDEHWTSDVFLGGSIGLLVGNWVVNLHENKDSRVQVSSLYPLSVKISLN